MPISSWLGWENGVDITASTEENGRQPNLIVHAVRTVFTPVGSGAAGLILFTPLHATQPSPHGTQPSLLGIITTNAEAGRYCASHIFAGTPFEDAPILEGEVRVEPAEERVEVHVATATFRIEATVSHIGVLQEVARPRGVLPYTQNTLEAGARHVALRIDGCEVPLYLPPGVADAPLALWKPCGYYAR